LARKKGPGVNSLALRVKVRVFAGLGLRGLQPAYRCAFFGSAVMYCNGGELADEYTVQGSLT
jgi:hypothetical protein